jgi:UDP-3-O-[3-hydroxymyristoyl] glucosamine N-acyltransferase
VHQEKPVSSLTLKEVADKLGGEAVGPDSLIIAGASSYESAGDTDLTFADNPRLLPAVERSRAAAVLVPRTVESSVKPIIRIDNPRLAFAQALELFWPRRVPEPGVHPTAVIGADVHIGREVHVGANAVVGDNVRLGDNVELHPLTYVGDEVEIGDGTIIYPRVSVYHRVRIGKHCIIHSGSVIGADGFGFVRDEAGSHIKVPQVGTVIIEDDVEIGANCAIDRATTDATIIGRGTKMDNLVQVGHNCKVGANCIICGQVGLSGSVEIGDGSVLAGQAGIADHITIGAGVTVCAQAGVIGDLPDGAFVSGYPAAPHREKLKAEAALRKLPDALYELRALRRRIEALEARLKE